MDYCSRSALRIPANLIVSMGYLLSIHSCLLDFLLAEFSSMGNTLASGVLEAITIGLIKQREKNCNEVVVMTSEVTGM